MARSIVTPTTLHASFVEGFCTEFRLGHSTFTNFDTAIPCFVIIAYMIGNITPTDASATLDKFALCLFSWPACHVCCLFNTGGVEMTPLQLCSSDIARAAEEEVSRD